MIFLRIFFLVRIRKPILTHYMCFGSQNDQIPKIFKPKISESTCHSTNLIKILKKTFFLQNFEKKFCGAYQNTDSDGLYEFG